jgi:serine/threonine protein phosphatase PrpC
MEDRVVTISPVSCMKHWSFFAVFDGHGGDFVVNYLSHNISSILARTIRSLEQEIGDIREDASSDVLETVLRRACATADLEVSRHPRMLVEGNQSFTCKDKSGSTGLMCLISKKHIAVANVGDSRAVLAQWGVTAEKGGVGAWVSTPKSGENTDSSGPVLAAIPLSVDHKFTIPGERERAERAGAM